RLLPATIALGLSQITFWLVEKPIRFNPFLVARPVLSLGIALIVAVLGISVASSLQARAREALDSAEQAGIRAAAYDKRTLFDAHCLTPAGVSRLRQCTYGDRESQTTVVLFGDSHAEHWFPALDSIAAKKHWRIVTVLKSSCPAARVQIYSVTLKRTDTECSAWREAALRQILELNPYLVILSEKDGSTPPAQWEQGLRSTDSYLSRHGLKTLVIADVPRPRLDIPTCLSRAAAHSLGARDCFILRDRALNETAR